MLDNPDLVISLGDWHQLGIRRSVFCVEVDRRELDDGGEDEAEAHEDVDVQGGGVGDSGQVVPGV